VGGDLRRGSEGELEDFQKLLLRVEIAGALKKALK
jgi:hypothetical protein